MASPITHPPPFFPAIRNEERQFETTSTIFFYVDIQHSLIWIVTVDLYGIGNRKRKIHKIYRFCVFISNKVILNSLIRYTFKKHTHTFHLTMQRFQIYIFFPLFENITLSTVIHYFMHQRHNKTFLKNPLEQTCNVHLYNVHTCTRVSSEMAQSKWTRSQRQSLYLLLFLTHLQVEIHIMLYIIWKRKNSSTRIENKMKKLNFSLKGGFCLARHI
jgi:hypothetical protein